MTRRDYLRRQADDAQLRAAEAQYDAMVRDQRHRRQHARNLRRMLVWVALVTAVSVAAALGLR